MFVSGKVVGKHKIYIYIYNSSNILSQRRVCLVEKLATCNGRRDQNFPCTGHCFYVIYIPTYIIIFTYIHLITYLATSSTHLNEKQFIYIYNIYIYKYHTSTYAWYILLHLIQVFCMSSLPYRHRRHIQKARKLGQTLTCQGSQRWPTHKKYPLGFAHGFFWGKKKHAVNL